MEGLRKCFVSFDEADSGFITCGVLYDLLVSAGIRIPPTVVDDLIESLDADAGTELSFAEFVDIAALLSESLE